jgi:hypothetical protein
MATEQTHGLTLVLSGASESTEEMANALFEAGCDDALLGDRDGVVFLDFEREAPTFRDAVLGAIRNVRAAGYDVARVEPDDLVTAAEIARRVGRSRESIRQLTLGVRGEGNFPRPVAGLKARSPLWRWSEVALWFARRGLPGTALVDADVHNSATIAAVNDMLDLLRHIPSKVDVIALLDDLRSPAPGPSERRTQVVQAVEVKAGRGRSAERAETRDITKRPQEVHR